MPFAHTRPTTIPQAQDIFRKVVKTELDALMAKGIERDVAVEALLSRIVQVRDDGPTVLEIRHVMRTCSLNEEDATRALIVKQELRRLKQRGCNPFEAIEELTCKMQGLSPMTVTSSTSSLPTTAILLASQAVSSNDGSSSSSGDDDDSEGEETPLHDVPMRRPRRQSFHNVSAESVFDAVPSVLKHVPSTNILAAGGVLVLPPLALIQVPSLGASDSSVVVQEETLSTSSTALSPTPDNTLPAPSRLVKTPSVTTPSKKRTFAVSASAQELRLSVRKKSRPSSPGHPQPHHEESMPEDNTTESLLSHANTTRALKRGRHSDLTRTARDNEIKKRKT